MSNPLGFMNPPNGGTAHWNVYSGVSAFTPGISITRSTDTTHREMKNDWNLIINPLFWDYILVDIFKLTLIKKVDCVLISRLLHEQKYGKQVETGN